MRRTPPVIEARVRSQVRVSSDGLVWEGLGPIVVSSPQELGDLVTLCPVVVSHCGPENALWLGAKPLLAGGKSTWSGRAVS